MDRLTDALLKFAEDWPSAAEALYGVELEPVQRQVIGDVQAGKRQIAVKSGHGVGKTALLALISQMFEMFQMDAKTVVTAPAAAQLQDAYVPEFRKWANRLPSELRDLWEFKQDRFTFTMLPNQPFENFVSIRTSRADQPDALQGVHAPHVLLIGDEASGIPDQVFEAAGGSMSSDHATLLLTGNPVRSTGYFYDCFSRLADHWSLYTISCKDSGRVSPEWIEEMMERYGVDSNAFRVRVLGEFPKGDDDTVIPVELIDSARNRDVEAVPLARRLWGLDVARFGSDRSVLCERVGNTVPNPPKKWRGLDTMQLVGAVKAEWDAREAPERPEEILVDVIGLGAGVVDRLRELELPARGVNVSESSSMSTQYLNLRAELWYHLKAWLERRDCSLPQDSELAAELAMVRYAFTSLGKIKIESKDDIKRRGISSPDLADALVLTFASDSATALHGWGPNSGWNRPLRTNLKGLV